MATLVLGIAGNLISPGLGGAIGAAIGAYIDQAFIFPPPDVHGPRLDGLQLQSGSEGSNVNFCLSNENRIAGNVVWLSKPHESAHEQGKGGPSNTTYTYSVDIGVVVCEGPIEGIEKIWANGALIYDANPDITIISSLISAASYEITRQHGDEFITTHFLRITSTGPDLTVFATGLPVVVSGFSTSVNNGSRRCVEKFRNNLTGVSYITLEDGGDVAVTDPGGETVTLFQDIPSFHAGNAAEFTFYLGTETQGQDPLIVAYEGAGNVPAYRGEVLVVIRALQLSNYGNSIPQMQFKAKETSSPKTLGAAVTRICSRNGEDSSQFDTSGLSGTLRGMTIRGPQSLVEQLRPLVTGYDILTQEDGASIKFFNRANADVVVVDPDDLAAHETGEDPDRPLKWKDTSPNFLPTHLSVSYTEPRNDYQPGSQVARRPFIVNNNWGQLDLIPLTLSASEAVQIAVRALTQAWSNARALSFQLPPSYSYLAEGDICIIPAKGETYRVLVTKVEQGANGQMLLEGISEQVNALTAGNVTADDPDSSTAGALVLPGEMFSVVAQIPPLRDEDVDFAGLYFGSCDYSPDLLFRGAVAYRSTDGGVTYTAIFNVTEEATLGRATNSLSATVVGYWDNVSTLTVVMNQGQLESHSDLEVYAGANWALYGQEVIAFKTATLMGINTYQISGGILRGLRSTDDKVGTHVAGEAFMLLNPASVKFFSYPQAHINSTHFFKVVPYGGIVADYSASSETLIAANLKPFYPCSMKGTRDGSNNLTITWVRRTRSLVRILGGTFTPLSEEFEKYEIDIYGGSGYTAVLRTIVVSSATSASYTAAEQTTDGLTPGNPVYLKAYMVSSVVGRGKPNITSV